MKISRSIFLFVVLCTGCSTQDICDDDNQSYLVARFLTVNNGEESDTTLTGLYVYGIRDELPGGLIYDSATVQKIMLPLDPNRDVTRYIFMRENQEDTLDILYSREAYLISYNCGFAARFYLDGPGHNGNLFTDIEVVNAQVDAETETNEEHFHIFF